MKKARSPGERNIMISFTFDLYQTLALSVVALTLGSYIRKKVSFFRRFCIPAPVIGGLVFAVLTCILYVTGIIEFSFDETMRDVCMVFFFTCVGFQADLKVLKEGGKSLLLFTAAIAILITVQNSIAVGMTTVLHVDPLVGLCVGSISLAGGHGTSGAFGPVLESCGLNGATTFCIASATYGLIAGGLIGGPIGNSLIRKKHLLVTASEAEPLVTEATPETQVQRDMHAPAVFQLITAVGFGTIVSWILSALGLKFPIYVGAMIVATVMRNISEFTGKFKVPSKEMNGMSRIFLNLFLGIAMITLKLWQLAELALPLIILLATQTIFMVIYANFVVFNMLGRDYDAAVITAGICGLGLGASPTAMANMQTLCRQYKPSVKAFLVVPIVGGVILDVINSLVITFFINLI